MRILAIILGLFLLLPGLCGAVFLPIGLMTPNDPYMGAVYVLSGIGLAIGALGVLILYLVYRRGPGAGHIRGWKLVGYLLLGLVGALMGFQLLALLFGLPLAFFGRGGGLGAIVPVVIGLAGFALVYWVAKKLTGGASPEKDERGEGE